MKSEVWNHIVYVFSKCLQSYFTGIHDKSEKHITKSLACQWLLFWKMLYQLVTMYTSIIYHTPKIIQLKFKQISKTSFFIKKNHIDLKCIVNSVDIINTRVAWEIERGLGIMVLPEKKQWHIRRQLSHQSLTENLFLWKQIYIN